MRRLIAENEIEKIKTCMSNFMESNFHGNFTYTIDANPDIVDLYIDYVPSEFFGIKIMAKLVKKEELKYAFCMDLFGDIEDIAERTNIKTKGDTIVISVLTNRGMS